MAGVAIHKTLSSSSSHKDQAKLSQDWMRCLFQTNMVAGDMEIEAWQELVSSSEHDNVPFESEELENQLMCSL